MRLGEKGAEFIEKLAEMGDEHPSLLTEWQQQFLDDYYRKVELYGDETYVTEKQLEQLNNIAEQLGFELIAEDELDNGD